MNLFSTKLLHSFQTKKVIKLITGIDNLDMYSIISITKAAELSGVTYLDVAANTKLIQLLKSISLLPICVSSISAIELYNCVVAGADLVEIGNFDACYKKGIYLTPLEILNLAKEVRSLVGSIDICVTIPYYISLTSQVRLAQDLEFLGINILQTEAVFNKHKSTILYPFSKNTFNTIYPSCPSLLSTYFISSIVQVPVITSSSINHISSNFALSLGASGIGISSIVKKQRNIFNMVDYLKSLKYLMSLPTFQALPQFVNTARVLDINSDNAYLIV